jgi:hypothetical protein
VLCQGHQSDSETYNAVQHTGGIYATYWIKLLYASSAGSNYVVIGTMNSCLQESIVKGFRLKRAVERGEFSRVFGKFAGDFPKAN